jgi:ribonuclease HI
MRRPPEPRPLAAPAEAGPGLEDLARALGIDAFDLLLVGDGSGTVYAEPAGWSCLAYDRIGGSVVLHAGAVTGGTNNFAELAPYVHALWFHHQEHPLGGPFRAHVVSDSELTVRCGNRQYARRANGALWAAVEWFERNGYRLRWHHLGRATSPWNRLADEVAGRARRLITELRNPGGVPR